LDKVFMGSGEYAGQSISSYEMYLKLRQETPNEIANAMVGCPHEIPMAFELPYMMCSSDAGVSGIVGSSVASHPQDAATFAKFLREMVVERRQLTLVDAISRITSLPAWRMNLQNKGKIKVGADADIVIFDIDKVFACADFPHLGKADAPPKGFKAVIIDGKIVVFDGDIKCTNAGKVLYAENTPWKL
jgi:N-acyl-D-amino-acid deacylase